VLRLDRFAPFWFVFLAIVGNEAFGWKDVRRGEHGAPAQFAYAGRFQQRFLARDLCVAARALGGLQFAPTQDRIGMIDSRDRLVQPLAVRRWQGVEQGAVGRDRFEQHDGGAHLFGQPGSAWMLRR
jgi:hypothetical protein